MHVAVKGETSVHLRPIAWRKIIFCLLHYVCAVLSVAREMGGEGGYRLFCVRMIFPSLPPFPLSFCCTVITWNTSLAYGIRLHGPSFLFAVGGGRNHIKCAPNYLLSGGGSTRARNTLVPDRRTSQGVRFLGNEEESVLTTTCTWSRGGYD